jgi:hypothetical protein
MTGFAAITKPSWCSYRQPLRQAEIARTVVIYFRQGIIARPSISTAHTSKCCFRHAVEKSCLFYYKTVKNNCWDQRDSASPVDRFPVKDRLHDPRRRKAVPIRI